VLAQHHVKVISCTAARWSLALFVINHSEVVRLNPLILQGQDMWTRVRVALGAALAVGGIFSFKSPASTALLKQPRSLPLHVETFSAFPLAETTSSQSGLPR